MNADLTQTILVLGFTLIALFVLKWKICFSLCAHLFGCSFFIYTHREKGAGGIVTYIEGETHVTITTLRDMHMSLFFLCAERNKDSSNRISLSKQNIFCVISCNLINHRMLLLLNEALY